VDYVQLLRSADKAKPDSRERQVAEYTRDLKALARELNVAVICVSQLNRGTENRQDKKPELSDLRESGAIEQDADSVIMLFRPGYYEVNDTSKTAEVMIKKNRHGAVGTVQMQFTPEITRFHPIHEVVEWD